MGLLQYLCTSNKFLISILYILKNCWLNTFLTRRFFLLLELAVVIGPEGDGDRLLTSTGSSPPVTSTGTSPADTRTGVSPSEMGTGISPTTVVISTGISPPFISIGVSPDISTGDSPEASVGESAGKLDPVCPVASVDAFGS